MFVSDSYDMEGFCFIETGKRSYGSTVIKMLNENIDRFQYFFNYLCSIYFYTSLRGNSLDLYTFPCRRNWKRPMVDLIQISIAAMTIRRHLLAKVTTLFFHVLFTN